MKTRLLNRLAAFTLIELLVVIAVIGILAGLLFTVMPGINAKRNLSLARSELAEIATAIEDYKARYGFYPPDNRLNVNVNPLYYELSGTLALTNASGAVVAFRTLDDSRSNTVTQIRTVFGLDGFVNSSTSRDGTDERPAPTAFLKELQSTRITVVSGVPVLASSVEWDGPGAGPNPWRYNSSSPTNNPGSYDLWVDLFLREKTNRVSNWSN